MYNISTHMILIVSVTKIINEGNRIFFKIYIKFYILEYQNTL